MIDYFELEDQANPGAFSRYDMEALVPELQELDEGDVYLEVGVDKGRSLWIARRFSKGRVVGVDLRVDPKVEGTEFYQGDSSEIAKTFEGEISVLFIDGDHSYEGCKADIDSWLPHMKKDGVILFHDCDETSPGVVRAVNEFGQKIDKEVKLFKTPEKNTSMALIRL